MLVPPEDSSRARWSAPSAPAGTAPPPGAARPAPRTAEYGGWNTSTGSSDDLNRLGSRLGATARSDNDLGPELAPGPSDLRTAETLGREAVTV
ncbi:hypothetical protein ACFC6L_16825 [Kitasatospora phosalacinea]|uniref:hypothetical protein n=1 Tax=Kitasatospora phosalacinea TaxID=2065 RepID=UPI0035E26F8F